MDRELQIKIEGILYKYACDVITAKEAENSLLKLGQLADLRKLVNSITAIESALTGQIVDIEV